MAKSGVWRVMAQFFYSFIHIFEILCQSRDNNKKKHTIYHQLLNHQIFLLLHAAAGLLKLGN
jgi:hypothetical protein